MIANGSAINDDDNGLHAVLASCLEEAERGPLDRVAIIARHPQFAAELKEFFAGRDLLGDLAAAIEPSALFDVEAGALGDFHILHEVGRGGMGIVYEAEQRSLRRRVALKVLPFATALDARQLQRFQNEAQAAAQLHHTNIVPVFAVGCDRGVHYYAMQFIDGRTIAALIRDLRQKAQPGRKLDDSAQPSPNLADTSPFAELSTEFDQKTDAYCKTVARIGAQAAEALEHAHGVGIVHRDIKPANLLVDVRGHLWITDFGLARLMNEPALTQSGDLLGTVRYMSPEQALGKPALVDARSDVYSLGATLYEMLTLEPAMAGTDRQELLRQITTMEPKPLGRPGRPIPTDLETIILKSIAKEPGERYESAREFAADLERFVRDQPIRARPPTWRTIAAKWLRRHKGVVRSAVGLLTLAAIAFAVTSWLFYQQAAQVRSEKQRAEDNLRLALDALDRLYLRAAEDRFARDPEWERQNRESLQTALNFYEELARKNSDGGAVRRLAARAYFRVGEICRRLEQTPQAEEAYRRAIALGESVIADFPGDAADREQLAGSLMNLGILLEVARRPTQAEAVLRRALAEYRAVADANPDQSSYRRSVANASQNLADVLESAGHPDQAEPLFRSALAIREDLLKPNPADAALREDLANTLQSLGRLLHAQSRYQEADALFRRAVPMLEALTAEFPDRVRYRQVLANGRNLLAAILREGHPKQALEQLQQALVESQSLAKEYPGVPEYRRRVASNHDLLGIMLTEIGRYPDAAEHYRQAIGLLDAIVVGPHVSKARADLADCHHNWGVLLRKTNSFDEAERHLRRAFLLRQKLVEEAGDVPVYWEHLGHTYSELGAVCMDRGQPAQAEEIWRQGLPIVERLARDWGAAPAHRRALASAHYDLARAELRAGHLPAAEEDCRKSLAIHAQMAEEFRTVPFYGHVRARDYDLLGMILEAAGRLAAAEDVYRQSAAAEQKLADEFKTMPEFRYSSALTALHLEGLLRKQGRLAEAEEFDRQALALLERLSSDSPRVTKYRLELANAFTRLATLLAKADRVGDAESAYRQVLVHYRRLVDDYPAIADYREKLGRAYDRLAGLLADSGRGAEAVDHYREAIKLNPKDGRATNNLAWLLVTAPDRALHDPSESIALAKRAIEIESANRDFWSTLGSAHYRAGEFEAARQALEYSLRLGGRQSGSEQFFLSMIWAQLGNSAQAHAWFDCADDLMKKHNPQDAELTRFRAEAAGGLALLPKHEPARSSR